MTTQVTKWRPGGPVLFAERDETKTPAAPKAFGEVHCLAAISVAMNITYLESINKCTAIRAVDAQDIDQITADGELRFQNYTPEAIQFALGARVVDAEVAPESEVAEVLPIVLEGQTVLLGGSSPNFNVTGLSIVDSSTAPQTLDLDTDYTVNLPFGMVAFGDVSEFTQPFKASYSHQNMKIYAALAAGRVLRWIRFQGTNFVDSSKIVPVDIFKAQLSPTSAWDLLPDKYGETTIKMSVQIDTSRQSTDPRGMFFYQGYGA